jgi:hypothetical protein
VAAAPPPRPKPVNAERPQLGTVAGSEQSFGIFVDQTTAMFCGRVPIDSST